MMYDGSGTLSGSSHRGDGRDPHPSAGFDPVSWEFGTETITLLLLERHQRRKKRFVFWVIRRFTHSYQDGNDGHVSDVDTGRKMSHLW